MNAAQFNRLSKGDRIRSMGKAYTVVGRLALGSEIKLALKHTGDTQPSLFWTDASGSTAKFAILVEGKGDNHV
jgi:hypothetical protein